MDLQRQNQRSAAYSKIAQKYTKLFIDELDSKPIDRKFYDLFFDRVVNKGPVLEIGCGPGEISNYLWKKGLKITGIDLSENMIAEAKKYNRSIPFLTGDVFDLKYERGSVYGIVAPYLIVNFSIKEVSEAFAEINRVMAKGGCFLVSFHIGHDNQRTFRNFIVNGNAITYTFFRVETIKRLLAKAGFAITEVVVKEPYEGEVTRRAYVFARK